MLFTHHGYFMLTSYDEIFVNTCIESIHINFSSPGLCEVEEIGIQTVSDHYTKNNVWNGCHVLHIQKNTNHCKKYPTFANSLVFINICHNQEKETNTVMIFLLNGVNVIISGRC